MNNEITGAGIICYYDNRNGELSSFSKEILYLILVDNNDKFDFPKGALDKLELINKSYFECALRETYEESNLDYPDFEHISKNNPVVSDNLIMYLGKLKKETMINCKQIIKIKPNPVLKIKEHKSYIFLNQVEAKLNILNYLNYFLTKAEKSIQ